MKSQLLFSVLLLFFLSPILSFSQTYKVDEMRIYSTDGVSSNWLLQNTAKYTYDNGGNKETKLESFIAPSTQASYQHIKTYNASNNIILEVKKNWISGWKNFSQTTYNYDGTNKLIKEITKNWDAGSMTFATNHTQILYEYSGDDVNLYTEQKWNTGWVDSQISEFVYSSPGVISYAIYSTIVSGTLYQEKETYFYDNGVIIKVEYFDPDGSGGWELNGQMLVDYVDGKIKTKRQQIYDNPEWTNEFLDSYSYDTNGNLIKLISSSWDEDITDWVEDEKVEWDYSVAAPFVLSTASFESESFKVFPNPASDVIHISSKGTIEKVELFDIVGKKVLSSFENKHINIEHLKSGVYVLKAFGNNQSTTRKFIKK